MIRKIYDEVLTHGECYQNLAYLCSNIGGRLSGSPQAEKAVNWGKSVMEGLKFDKVELQPVMVPHWIRGDKEKAYIINSSTGVKQETQICALGGSIATPDGGIEAEVIEVKSFEDLEKLGKEKIKGKIVFYNVKMDAKHIHTGEAYGESVKYRYSGASMAAKFGAIGSIVRSMTLALNNSPHTGVMAYDTVVKTKIPSCAISTLGAEELSNELKSNKKIILTIKMSCKTLADEPSYSVVGELKGSKYPNEIIVVGGHLDSWDNGDGAHDDGAGVVQSVAVIEGYKKLGIKPNRTIRAVAFMNEENGTRGAKSYAMLSLKNKNKHIAALESDAGGFTPRAIGVAAGKDTLSYFKKWQPLFEPYDVKIKQGWGGTDIEPLAEQGAILFGFEPDTQRYFDYHHTQDDTFDKVNKRELELGAATMHSFIYLIDKYGLMKVE
jgi:hypothetical protein